MSGKCQGILYWLESGHPDYVTPIVLYTKVDVHFDDLAVVIGQTKLTTLATGSSVYCIWDKVSFDF